MNNDLLKTKINEARNKLPRETREAIDNVNWKTKILELREKKGYSYTQLDDLEIETELLLCGILNPEDYPNELGKRMNLSQEEVRELVDEINRDIFQKIKQELIKILEYKEKKESVPSIHEIQPAERKIFKETGIEIMPEELSNGKTEEKNEEISKAPIKPLEKINSTTPKKDEVDERFLPSEKFFNSFKSKDTRTEHSLNNSNEKGAINMPPPPKPNAPKIDPYREIPE